MMRTNKGYSILKTILFFLITLSGWEVLAQNVQTVRGVVYDERLSEPLSGVNVRLKESDFATITDSNGRFGIRAKNNDVLVFSLLGYDDQEIAIRNAEEIIVHMKVGINSLEEVVVIGYGSQKKEDLTGSVGIVNVEQMEQAPVMSFDQALAGRIAGVQVNMSEGQPGAEGVNIVIRGPGSLTQDVSPLYVVDGFPNEHFDPSSLNMNDIESINILKDASAIAIYGARASAGVVVIETKKGKIGKPIVTYNGSFGTQEILQRMEMMSAYEFVRYQVERGTGQIYLTNDRTLEDYTNVKGIDWQDQILRTGKTYINNIAIRGGGGGTRYSISGSMFNNDGIIINTGQARYQGRVSLDQEITKKLSVGMNLNYSSRNFFGTQASSASGSAASASTYLLYGVLGYRPITSRVDFDALDLLDQVVDDEVDMLIDYRVNPVVNARNEYNKTFVNSLITNAYLQYKIGRYFTFKAQGSINTQGVNREYFYNSQTARGNERSPGNVRGQWGGKTYSDRFTWSNENTLTYKRTFEKAHNVDGMLGFSNQRSQVESDGYIGINVPNESMGIHGLGAGQAYTIDGSASEYTLQSYFGRANYNYRSRYFLTGTFRADGSSRFSPKNKWAYFPSAAIAWRVSREKFLKDIKVVHDAKVRMSYGHTGNNRVSDYADRDLLQFSQSVASYSWGNSAPVQGVYMSSVGNPDLKWETTEQFDVGLDLSLFKNKVEFVFDYYTRLTRDLLLFANMPHHTGYTRVYKNVGNLRNSGLEFTLSTVNFDNKKFKWESNFNITFNKNKIMSLTDGEDIWLQTVAWNQAFNTAPLYVAEVGQPAGQMFGYIWEGNYQYEDFVDDGTGGYTQLKPGVPYNNPARTVVQPGDIKYKDLNGDGIVDDSDRTIIGRGLPIHTGGFYNGFSYKGFQLGVLLHWMYGNDVFNANKIMFEGGPYVSLNQFASYADRWSPENPTDEHYRAGGNGPVGRYSTKHIEDGSFLRLKTIDFGYTIPKNILNKYNIASLSFNVAAQNLFVWDSYSGFDPEVSTRPTVLTPSFDFSAYPPARTVVVGLKMTY